MRILATSRELLRVPAETAWRVPSLGIPGSGVAAEEVEGSGAVRLFLERARAASPQLEVAAPDLPLVAEICQRLDGIPLAIELAAARTRVLSLREILERLDDRFRLLVSGARTGPERHRTLQAVVDWSYQSLTPLECALFERLSVFPGGFVLEAAEQVCAGEQLAPSEVLGILSSLVDKSMLVVDRVTDATRYRLLETLRQYGEGRLVASGADGLLRERHLAWAISFAGRAELELDGSAQGAWLERLDAEHDNLRQALRWAKAADGWSLLSLAASLGRFWEIRGFLSEGRRWLESGLANGHGRSGAVEAKAHRWAGVLGQRQGDYDAARRHHQAGLTLSRATHDQQGTASALHSLGNLEGLQGRLDTAAALYGESLAIGRTLADGRIVAASLTNLGWIAQTQSDFDRARQLTLESVAAWQELGDQRGVAQALSALAYVDLLRGDHEIVRSRCEESLVIQRELGDRYGEAWSLTYLGWAAQNEGELTTARELHERALGIRRQLGDRYGKAWSLSHLGEVARAGGDLEQAQVLLDESLAIARELGDTYCIAWCLLRLGKVAGARNDLSTAEDLLRQGLAAAGQRGDRIALAASLEELARTFASMGRFEQAARLVGTADALRRRTGAVLPHADQESYDRTVAAVRRALGREGFEAISSACHHDDIDGVVHELGLPSSALGTDLGVGRERG